MVDLDSACYIINNVVYSSGPSATLIDAEFPVGVSEVMVIGYFEDKADTCEFTVTVTRTCPDNITDNETNTYKVTELEGLCWTSNMKVTKYADDTPIVWAKPYTSSMYPDGAANLAIFGRLYTWYSAVGIPEGSSDLPITDKYGNIQGICPNGWHIPTQAKWDLLNAYSAPDLMSTQYWLNAQGTNAIKFDAVPAGRYDANTYMFKRLYGYSGFWASDVTSGQFAHSFYLTYYCNTMLETTMNKADGLSVRCVLDEYCDK